MEESQEDIGRRDVRIGAGIGHPGGMRAQIETFVQPSRKRK
jgi:hypothetical protein